MEAQQTVAPPRLVCPHCGQRAVATWTTREKAGVSGGKLAAALLTCGLSVLATGLSRHETVRRFACESCKVTWAVRA